MGLKKKVQVGYFRAAFKKTEAFCICRRIHVYLLCNSCFFFFFNVILASRYTIDTQKFFLVALVVPGFLIIKTAANAKNTNIFYGVHDLSLVFMA